MGARSWLDRENILCEGRTEHRELFGNRSCTLTPRFREFCAGKDEVRVHTFDETTRFGRLCIAGLKHGFNTGKQGRVEIECVLVCGNFGGELAFDFLECWRSLGAREVPKYTANACEEPSGSIQCCESVHKRGGLGLVCEGLKLCTVSGHGSVHGGLEVLDPEEVEWGQFVGRGPRAEQGIGGGGVIVRVVSRCEACVTRGTWVAPRRPPGIGLRLSVRLPLKLAAEATDRDTQCE